MPPSRSVDSVCAEQSSRGGGVFGYADDLDIVSPTLFGIRQIIEICEEYASEMDLLFNQKKYK